ncbi:MAG: glycosyltransferase [Thermodesulfobacteriota bacterium]
MNLWEKNLEVLCQAAPELAASLARTQIPVDHRLLSSRKGPPSLEVGQQRLHSSYDPVKEGEDWAQAQNLEAGEALPLVVFGLGLGYHLLPWLKAGRPFFVVEPDPAVARLALENQDLTSLLARNGLRLGRDFKDLPRPARLLTHPPSRRLHSGLHHRLAAFLAGEPEREGALRILVVGPLHGGSQPIAGYTARACRHLGHETELLDFTPFYPAYQALQQITAEPQAAGKLNRDLFRLLGETLLSRVRDFRPDLLFFLAQAPVDPALLRTLKTEVPLLAYWFVEDFQVFPYWQDLAPEVDVFFVLQKEPFFQELKRLGVRNYACLPLAADPEVYHPLELTPEERRRYGAALSFVGAGYYNRREFFPGLLDFDFKIWGSEWSLTGPLSHHIQNQAARVSEEEAVKIFNATRINLNLHSSPFHGGINPQGDYLNPRVFDLAACGAFQLVDWRNQLPEFFTPDRELVTFTSLAEAREKIDYYLAHEEERRLIAQQGRERCLREHTYASRLATALEIIEDFHPGVLPHRPRAEAPFKQLRSFFPVDHPVQTLLGRSDLAEITDLSELVQRLKEAEEPLTEAEAIFWLLDEFYQGYKRGRF